MTLRYARQLLELSATLLPITFRKHSQNYLRYEHKFYKLM